MSHCHLHSEEKEKPTALNFIITNTMKDQFSIRNNMFKILI